jgi:hypothetical protein
MTVFITDVRYGDRLTQIRREVFGDNFPGKRPRPRLAQKGRATTWGAGWVAAREPSWHTKERGNSSSGTTFPGFILGVERRLGLIERGGVPVAVARSPSNTLNHARTIGRQGETRWRGVSAIELTGSWPSYCG